MRPVSVFANLFIMRAGNEVTRGGAHTLTGDL